MLKQFGWIDVAVAAMSAVVVGYVLGGFVYQHAGDGFWPTFKDWQTLATGLIAIGVGWAAWRGIHAAIDADRRATDLQIAANREDLERELRAHEDREAMNRRRRLIALADSTSPIPMWVFVLLQREPSSAIPAYYAEMARAGVREIMEIDSRLGVGLSALAVDIEEFNAMNAGERPVWAPTLIVRCHLLGEAIQVCSRSLDLTGDVPMVGLLTEEFAHTLIKLGPTDESARGWTKSLFGPRFSPEKPHPSLPA